MTRPGVEEKLTRRVLDRTCHDSCESRIVAPARCRPVLRDFRELL